MMGEGNRCTDPAILFKGYGLSVSGRPEKADQDKGLNESEKPS